MDGQQIDKGTAVLIKQAKEKHLELVERYKAAIQYAEEQRQQAGEKADQSNNWWRKLTGEYYDALGKAQWETDRIQDLQEAIAEQDEKLEQEIKYWEQRGEKFKEELQTMDGKVININTRRNFSVIASKQDHKTVVTLGVPHPDITLPKNWFWEAVFDRVVIDKEKKEALTQFAIPDSDIVIRLEEKRLFMWEKMIEDYPVLVSVARPEHGKTREDQEEKARRIAPKMQAYKEHLQSGRWALQAKKRSHGIPVDTMPIAKPKTQCADVAPAL